MLYLRPLLFCIAASTWLMASPLAAAGTFEVQNCDSDPRWAAMAAPGTATMSPASIGVGQRLGQNGVPRLALEVALPEDVLVLGRGLPELLPGDDPLLSLGYDVDRSVLQIELPQLRPPASAEEEVRSDHSTFSPARVCVVDAPYVPIVPPTSDTGDTGTSDTSTSDTGAPHTGLTHTGASTGDPGGSIDYADATCPYDREDTLGMWRAWRVRDHPDGSCAVTEVQLARTIRDQVDSILQVPRMGVWLEEGDTLEGGDRVLVEMQVTAPTRATDWTDSPYKPNIRWAHTSCLGHEETTWPGACFDALDPDSIDGLEVAAGPPTFLRINMPMDATRGEVVRGDFVLLDEHGNPTTHTSDPSSPIVLSARSATTGTAAWSHDLTFDGSWTETVVLPFNRPGAWTAEADVSGSDLPDLTVIRHWTRTWRDAPDMRRAAGDLHFHTGITEDPVSFAPARFLPTSAAGDHRLQVASTELAYRYLEDVMGLQFGAASEHAVAHSGYTLPSDPAFDPFRAGGVCDIGPIVEDIPDWWGNLQQLDMVNQHPGFTIFPAFEWHAHQRTLRNGIDVDNSRLHRVVVYREVPPLLDLPMLPGTATDLAPQCLPLFLIASGWGEPDKLDDMVTIPHMSRHQSNNLDWDLQYDWSGEFADLLAHLDPDPAAARALIEQQARLVEVFSARAAQNDSFEGRWLDGANPKRWTIRYGLAQGAHVGFVGNSDNHGQQPGGNNDPIEGQTEPAARHHEPGGLAFVLADGQSTPRDGIFDALRARRTYATTGIRAWMDVTITDPGQPVLAPVYMGGTHTTASCSLDLDVDLLAGMEIQAVDLLAAQVLHTPGGVSTSWRKIPIHGGKVPTETFRHSKTIPHPGEAGEWVYYVRGSLGSTEFPDQELAWASPIWVTWGDPALCP